MNPARTRWITIASIVSVALIFAFFAYKRRWIADDGLIYVRIVRQILDGNGPVFNAFERIEANTSALWPWLVALFSVFSYEHVEWIAVGLGGACSVAGLVLAMDGTRRWHRSRGYLGPLVPGAACVLLAVFPFWDFATSGLENGLCLLWLGLGWWLLTSLARDPTQRRQRLAAFVFGLGPLVRPELGLCMALFLVAGWLIVRPMRRETVRLFLTAIAAPLAYEIFRAGFYGTLVPLPALAKSASAAEWSRGALYLTNFVLPYRLWLPLGVLAICFGIAIKHWSNSTTHRVLVITPVISGLLTALYIVRVGGDFMHGRMWLSPTFMVVLPALLLPVTPLLGPALVILTGWGLFTYRSTNDLRREVVSPYTSNERFGYVRWTRTKNPIDERDFLRALGGQVGHVQRLRLTGSRTLTSEGAGDHPLGTHVAASLAFVAGRLGTGGSLMSTDEIVVDTLGLANPIGARIPINLPNEGPGHQKLLGRSWLLADFGDPAHDHDRSGADAVNIRAARHAMSCGALAELLASVREPLTIGRFFRNLTGSIGRTRLVIPDDPLEAERKFCGLAAAAPKVVVSSSYEAEGWAAVNLIDGNTTSPPTALGYTSAPGNSEPHEEWIELQFPAKRPISGLVLFPRADPGYVGRGFPIDFAIETWDGTRWTTRATANDVMRPTSAAAYSFAPTTTDRVRLRATELEVAPGGGRMLQLAELAALP